MADEGSIAIDRAQYEGLVSQLYQKNSEVLALMEKLEHSSGAKNGMTWFLLSAYRNYLGKFEEAESLMIKAFAEDSQLIQLLLPKESPNFKAKIKDRYDLIEVAQCPVCGSERRKSIFVATTVTHVCYHDGLSPLLHWVQCEECTHVYTRAQNPSEALFEGPERATKHSSDISLERYTVDYESVQHLAEACPRGTVLEIGPGNGTRSGALRDLGLDVLGLEIQENLVEHCRSLGLNVEHGDFLTHSPREGSAGYDVMVLGDVIEHLSDLQGSASKFAELVLDEGFLWISTPIFDNFYLEHRRKLGLDPYFFELEHWQYFTRASLLKLLGGHGFRVRKQRYSKNFVGSVELTFQKRG